jgi:hypothetical protein
MLHRRLTEIHLRAAQFKVDLLKKCKAGGEWQDFTPSILQSEMLRLGWWLQVYDPCSALFAQQITEVACQFSEARNDLSARKGVYTALKYIGNKYDRERRRVFQKKDPDGFTMMETAVRRILKDLEEESSGA